MTTVCQPIATATVTDIALSGTMITTFTETVTNVPGSTTTSVFSTCIAATGASSSCIPTFTTLTFVDDGFSFTTTIPITIAVDSAVTITNTLYGSTCSVVTTPIPPVVSPVITPGITPRPSGSTSTPWLTQTSGYPSGTGSSLPAQSTGEAGEKSFPLGAIIGAAVGGFALLAGAGFVAYKYFAKGKAGKPSKPGKYGKEDTYVDYKPTGKPPPSSPPAPPSIPTDLVQSALQNQSQLQYQYPGGEQYANAQLQGCEPQQHGNQPQGCEPQQYPTQPQGCEPQQYPQGQPTGTEGQAQQQNPFGDYQYEPDRLPQKLQDKLNEKIDQALNGPSRPNSGCGPEGPPPPGYDQPQQGYYGQGQQEHGQGQGHSPTPNHAHSQPLSYSPPAGVPPQHQYGQPNLGYPQQHQPHSRPTSAVYGQPVPTPGFPVPQGGPPPVQGQYNVPVPGPGAYAAQVQPAQANLASQYKGYAEPMRGLPPK